MHTNREESYGCISRQRMVILKRALVNYTKFTVRDFMVKRRIWKKQIITEAY